MASILRELALRADRTTKTGITCRTKLIEGNAPPRSLSAPASSALVSSSWALTDEQGSLT